MTVPERTPPARPVRSLGSRLSTWLAIQGVLAALIVSAILYSANAWIVRNRQEETLHLKREVVRHALAETAAGADLKELKHRFDDFLAGHDDMGLLVRSSAGATLYVGGVRRPTDVPGPVRIAMWQERWPRDGGEISIRLTLDSSQEDALLLRLGAILVLASLSGAAIVAYTGFLLVRRGLDPVRQLSAQVESISPGRPELRLDGSSQPAELLPLVEGFNSLLARAERAYAQLEGFNADVAHELRTPLTTLIGASELALHRKRSAEELRDIIATNLEDLRRLAGIVNDMLFLSHADRGATARRTPVPSLTGALQDILDYHDAALHERNLTAEIAGDCAGEFDVALLRRALSNLISNATRYATPGSRIRVSIEPEREETVSIAVADEGTSIGEEHLPKLFDRFYRAERSRRQGGSNHGLGLAIVAAIARMHGGQVFAESEPVLTTIGLRIPIHR